MKVDPAILRCLSANPAQATLQSHGGSGFSTTGKLTVRNADGTPSHFFVKTGSGKESEVMFRGEHASLNAIHSVVPSLCPASLGFGALDNEEGKHFLITEFLDLGRPGSASSAFKADSPGLSLAAKLAKLHTTPAPIPEGHDSPMFGFPVTTCCGDTPQDNTFTSSWPGFYADNRLRGILARCEFRNGADATLRDLIERTASIIISRGSLEMVVKMPTDGKTSIPLSCTEICGPATKEQVG